MKRGILLVLGLLAGVAVIRAVPARQGVREITLEDGRMVEVATYGDEYFHYTQSEDGRWFKEVGEGLWKEVPALDKEAIAARRAQSPRRIKAQTETAVELNLAPRGLVIMVNFKNKKFRMSQAEMDSMINGSNFIREYEFKDRGKTQKIKSFGSARQYFETMSYGQYCPKFDVMGPVTVSHNYEYYGENSWWGSDENPEEMVIEACKLVHDSMGVDFSNYDNNHDGEVDFVYVFYAGYGEADGGDENTIWPHSYSMAYYHSEYLDGKLLGKYACSNEQNYISKVHDGVGTFIHEFSHVLGLPDLYATNSADHKTMGAWDCMDYGPYNNDGNTPPAYSAYERFFMGWLTPTLLTESADITLRPVKDSAALIVTSRGEHNMVGNDPNPNTFFMVENRQQKGWDEFLPGHGMMLTKVVYSSSAWEGNTVNNSSNGMGVDIIEADGKKPKYSSSNRANGYFGKSSDLFPEGATEYQSVAPFNTYTITDIEETEDGMITFKYMGGGEPMELGEEHQEPEPQPTAMDEVHNDVCAEAGVYDLLGRRIADRIEEVGLGYGVVIVSDGTTSRMMMK